MKDEEFLARLGTFYDVVQEFRSDDDYEIDEKQALKFYDALAFFREQADELGGKIEDVILKPTYVSGGITATFVIFDVKTKDVSRFCEILQNSTGLYIEATNDGEVRLSITIPNVFRRKPE